MADNDSTIAWHRAQLKKHREAAQEDERDREYRVPSPPKRSTDTPRLVSASVDESVTRPRGATSAGSESIRLVWK